MSLMTYKLRYNCPLYIVHFPLFIVILTFNFQLSTFNSFAQDSSKPVIMSQAAYDSTLRALKKAKNVLKDSVKITTHNTEVQNPDSNLANTIHEMARQKLIDSLWKKAAHRDSLVKADSLAKVHNNLLNQKMLDSTHKAHRECTGYFALNGGMGLPVSNYATTGAAAAGRDFSICAEFPGTISRY